MDTYDFLTNIQMQLWDLWTKDNLFSGVRYWLPKIEKAKNKLEKLLERTPSK